MGSTKQATIYLTHVQDHPHIHGEHSRPAWRYRTTTGSPPYTWGAQPLNSPFSNWDKDHPHIHGEHPSANRLHDRPSGSPPYTWGAQKAAFPAKGYSWITPIYMGSTNSGTSTDLVLEDHPHIHGEHITTPSAPFAFIGSPPYTWGAQNFHPFERGIVRITPIYMGSTTSRHLLTRARWDHPHIHGEHHTR